MVGVVLTVGEVARHLVVGVVVLHQMRPTTRSVTQGPNARTLRELKRLGLHTKGERQDIAH